MNVDSDQKLLYDDSANDCKLLQMKTGAADNGSVERNCGCLRGIGRHGQPGAERTGKGKPGADGNDLQDSPRDGLLPERSGQDAEDQQVLQHRRAV